MSTPASALDDPRWQVFNSAGYTCSCGETHVGLFPIETIHPIGWPGPKEYEPNERVKFGRDFLSKDFNVWQDKYFAVRMRLPLAIAGAEPWAFMFTVWGGLSRDDFANYVLGWREHRLPIGAFAPARLANRLAGFADTANLMGSAIITDDSPSPLLLIHGAQPDNDPNHSMIPEQRNGISVDRMFDLFAAHGHDMRPNFS